MDSTLSDAMMGDEVIQDDDEDGLCRLLPGRHFPSSSGMDPDRPSVTRWFCDLSVKSFFLPLGWLMVGVGIGVLSVTVFPHLPWTFLSLALPPSQWWESTMDSSSPPSPLPPSSSSAFPSLPPLHWSSVLSRVSSGDRQLLIQRLQGELARLQSLYPNATLLSDSSFLTSPSLSSSHRTLGSSLTAAYFGLQPSFVIGVTGGSSTAGSHSWAPLLVSHLQEYLGLSTAEVRNAAQGSTSQLVTAPCIHQLVGAKTNQSAVGSREEVAAHSIDLLMWEFAMNDEAMHIHRSSAQGGGPPTRHRVAEMWMRGALQMRVPALGFLHFWDITINAWAWEYDWIPDRAWLPTNDVLLQYGTAVEAFAVNTIEFIRAGGVVDREDKAAFLRDEHHPNRTAVVVAVHLLVHAMVRLWLRFLLTPLPSTVSLDLVDPLQLITPLYRARQKPFDLPSFHLRAACLTSAEPQFALSNVVSLYCQPDSVEWVSTQSNALMPAVCQGWSTQQVGKADPSRADRKVQLVPAECVGSGSAAVQQVPSMEVRVREIDRWRYLLLDCGLFSRKCNSLRVSVNGQLVQPNVNVSGDIFEAFYNWVHVWDEPFVSRRAQNGFDSIHICSEAPVTENAEDRVVVQRIVIWYSDL